MRICSMFKYSINFKFELKFEILRYRNLLRLLFLFIYFILPTYLRTYLKVTTRLLPYFNKIINVDIINLNFELY